MEYVMQLTLTGTKQVGTLWLLCIASDGTQGKDKEGCHCQVVVGVVFTVVPTEVVKVGTGQKYVSNCIQVCKHRNSVCDDGSSQGRNT